MFILVRVIADTFNYHTTHFKGEVLDILYKDAGQAIRNEYVDIVVNDKGENKVQENNWAPTQIQATYYEPSDCHAPPISIPDKLYPDPLVFNHSIFDSNEYRRLLKEYDETGSLMLSSGKAHYTYLNKFFPGITYIADVKDVVNGNADYTYCECVYDYEGHFVVSVDAGNEWRNYHILKPAAKDDLRDQFLIDLVIAYQKNKSHSKSKTEDFFIQPPVRSPGYVAPGHFSFRPYVLGRVEEPTEAEKLYERQLRAGDFITEDKFFNLRNNLINHGKFTIILGDAEEKYLQKLIGNYLFLGTYNLEGSENKIAVLLQDTHYYIADFSKAGEATFEILVPGLERHKRAHVAARQLHYHISNYSI